MFLNHPEIDIGHDPLSQALIMIMCLCNCHVLKVLLFRYQAIQLLAELLMNHLSHFLLGVLRYLGFLHLDKIVKENLSRWGNMLRRLIMIVKIILLFFFFIITRGVRTK